MSSVDFIICIYRKRERSFWFFFPIFKMCVYRNTMWLLYYIIETYCSSTPSDVYYSDHRICFSRNCWGMYRIGRSNIWGNLECLSFGGLFLFIFLLFKHLRVIIIYKLLKYRSLLLYSYYIYIFTLTEYLKNGGPKKISISILLAAVADMFYIIIIISCCCFAE